MSDSSTNSKRCQQCGAEMSAAAGGLCPRCLMAQIIQPTQAGDPAAAIPALTPAELAPHFPQLEILECLGRGGMGVVYKARQKTLNRLVALKLLAPERVTDAKFAERFTHEAQALAALNHPSIVTIYDFGQAGGFYYLLMEFVDGVNLRQAMKAGRFTPEQALAVVPPVCDALQYAHEHGIVHRDIKPENLLLDKEGRVKIADFGIAKILGAPTSATDGSEETAPGVADLPGRVPASQSEPTLASLAGTPQYMAPEQKAHRATDHRADIYSLGVVLYELLTGELPADKLQPPSRKVQIDVRLDEIVLRALEKSPELRYQTAGEFRTQVVTMTSGAGVPPVEPRVAAGPSRFSRTAIWAASWILLCTIVVPPFIWHELETHEFMRAGPFASPLGCLIWFVFLIPAFAAPLGATLLGWIAVTQIRRSAGKLHGLWLAVFDGLLFPLLAVDVLLWDVASRALIAFSNWQAHSISQHVIQSASDPASTFELITRLDAHGWLQGIEWNLFRLVMLVVVILVDWLIIRRVWRAVNRLPGAATSTTSAAPRPSSRTGYEEITTAPRFSRTAIVGACWAPFAIAFLWFFFAKQMAAGEYHDPPRWLTLLAIVLGGIGVTAPLGTTILGWISVSQIRRSAGKIWGLGLAVFDGLFFPLLLLGALMAYGVLFTVRAFISMNSTSRAVYRDSLAGRVHLGLPVRLANYLDEHRAAVLFSLCAVNVVVWILITRSVWRAVKRSASDSTRGAVSASGESSASALGGLAITFAVLSGILGSIAWVLLRNKAQVAEGFMISILVSALLGVVMGVAAWKHRLGKMAATVGFINAAIWVFCTVFAPLTEQLSPTEARAAIKQALEQEITKQLTRHSERFVMLSVSTDHELKTASVTLGGLQEMRGVEGRNEWVDVDGSLSVFNDGGDWIVKGDGALGAILFIVPLADLTRAAQAHSDAQMENRSRTPKSVHITRNAGTVLVHHDDVDLHYVFFAPKAVGSSGSDQYDSGSLAWRDHGSFKLTEQQTFGYDRESTDPFHLQINGKEYDLRRGRVLVPHDDGTVEQFKLFPTLATAKSPEELAKLTDEARTMSGEPVNIKKLCWQLQAAAAQLQDARKTCAPTHPFVLEVSKSIEALEKKIAEQDGETAASATFGPVIERELAIPAENSLPPVWLDLDNGKEISTTGFTGDLDQPGAFPTWLKQQGADLASGRFETAETIREKDRSPPDKGTPFYEHGLYAWSGIGLNAMAVKPDLWDSADATALLAMNTAFAAMADSGFQKLIPEGQSPQNLKGKLPATFLFKTAEGHMGLIQIVDFTKEMRSVKVRSKLVKAAGSGAAIPADTQRSVLEAELGQARTVAAQQEVSYKAGTLNGVELQKAKDKVEILEARLTGGAVRVAEARLASARRQWELASARHQAGVLSHAELETAKGEVSIAEAGLREATAKVPVTPAVTAQPAFGPVMERGLPGGEPCREVFFQFRSGDIFIVGNGPGTSPDEAAFDYKRIDDAGGVDMSAISGDESIQIAGRGCFFTQDVQTLNWDRFTAEQAVEAVKNVSFVEGVMEPKKGEFPITYLFKTARGEVGIMEVLGTVEIKHGDWSEHGMKFRYKLVQGTGSTTITPSKITLPALNFGKETQGMQAALAVTPGEPFGLRIYLRNVSDKAIVLDGASYRQADECLLTDANGKPVPITRVTHDIKVGMGGGYHGPGQVAIFESAGLSFQSLDKVPSSAGYVAQAKPGRYTLRMKLRLPGDDVPFAPNQGVWHGELETGPVTIEVKDPAILKVASVADAIWSSHLGKPVEVTVNDLQTTHENCALNLDTGKLMSVPASITLDALSQNKLTKEPAPSVAEASVRAQDEALTWARNNQVDAVTFVTTKDGKVVKCGLLCPELLVFHVENKAWTPDLADPRMLKEHFEKAMHEWNFKSRIAEITSDGDFPTTYLILDTRTHRRGVLQILGMSDNPRGVKISYRLIEGAAVKKNTPVALPTAPKPAATL